MHRNFRPLVYVVLALAFAVCGAHRSQAQCSNGSINSAYQTALHRAPRGSGNGGECNPAYYGGGSWSGQADLVKRVGAASYCSNNPWIGQIYLYEYNRYPNWNECTANYGYNSSMSYMQLDQNIKSYVASGGRAPAAAQARPPYGQYLVASNGALIDWNGATVAQPGTYVIAVGGANVINAGGANVINAGGANVINAGGANLVAPQAGWVIAAGSGNLAATRSVMSANGKRVITATSIRK